MDSTKCKKKSPFKECIRKAGAGTSIPTDKETEENVNFIRDLAYGNSQTNTCGEEIVDLLENFIDTREDYFKGQEERISYELAKDKLQKKLSQCMK
jgi:hypothetical protein